MYRPVHSTRRSHAKALLARAGYADGGGIEGGADGIEPDNIPQEADRPEIISKPIPPPIATHRKLGRRARVKLRS